MKIEKTLEIIRPNIKASVNKTTAFIIPALDLNTNKLNYKLLEMFGFVNCYLWVKNSPYKNDSYVYLVFNPTKEGLANFYRLYSIYRTYNNFVADYMLDYNLIVVVLKVKEKWKHTYEMFKQSKYSQMSKEYADLFKTVTLSGKVTVGYQYLIIHKHKEYKEHLEKELDVHIDSSAELMDRLDPEKEIFNYERALKIQSHERECQVS